ncbi:hypothetical protein ACH4TC_39780 [Streptomyces spororaveus]|uniref:hypothetical protein n=1 Tax=Streptomyces spororaveus TaxID=284039 RepID=UPI002079BA52|nr:hypothetical protein [Streptomyces spororaveus]MCM9077251.1 hypothetical protein [Streptomyces spororaveus]
MARTSRKQRFAMFTVSAALVTGGALVPTSAFAAQTTPHTEAAAFASGHGDHTKSDHRNAADHHEHGGKDRSKGRKNKKPRDVENMPGCKFYQGKVYCEHKPDTPKPAPAGPKPAPAPDAADRENPDRVPAPGADGFGIELGL